MPSIRLSNLPLKTFLELFHDQDPVERLELGDTLHPKAGWVDKAYFESTHGKIDRVKDLKSIPYDFPGLFFEAVINQVKVKSGDDDSFEVESKDKARLQIILGRFRELKSVSRGFENAEIAFSKGEVY